MKRTDSLLVLALLSVTAPLGACSHLFYHPSREAFSSPKRARLPVEEVAFSSTDGTPLSGWFFPAASPPPQDLAPTVIQFHGNAQNMTAHFASVFWMVEAGYQVFTFDYRGYGKSGGSPDQRGLHQDALAAIREVERRMPGRKRDIILYGQSLGGAVVARALQDLSSKERISAVVLEGTFDAYRSIARNMLARSWITFLFQPLAGVLVSDEYSPEESFAKISPIPLLVIHGEKDPAIPASFGRRIHSLAEEPKTLWIIPRGRHIDSMSRESGRYRADLIGWLEENRLR
jgi:fermentation-respiration switch protein FrsA (DUF1100 family)